MTYFNANPHIIGNASDPMMIAICLPFAIRNVVHLNATNSKGERKAIKFTYIPPTYRDSSNHLSNIMVPAAIRSIETCGTVKHMWVIVFLEE